MLYEALMLGGSMKPRQFLLDDWNAEHAPRNDQGMQTGLHKSLLQRLGTQHYAPYYRRSSSLCFLGCPAGKDHATRARVEIYCSQFRDTRIASTASKQLVPHRLSYRAELQDCSHPAAPHCRHFCGRACGLGAWAAGHRLSKGRKN